MARLHGAVGTATYEAWFARLKLDAFEGATARLSVPTTFLRRWIESRHKDLVLRCVRAEVPYIRRVRIDERSRWFVQSPPMAMLPPPLLYDDMGADEPRDTRPVWSAPVVSPLMQMAHGVRARKIIQMAGDHWGIRKFELTSSRRTGLIVISRQTAMYAMRMALRRSLPWIGYQFGGKDHTTVLHAVRTIEVKRRSDPYIGSCVENIFREIGHDEAVP